MLELLLPVTFHFYFVLAHGGPTLTGFCDTPLLVTPLDLPFALLLAKYTSHVTAAVACAVLERDTHTTLWWAERTNTRYIV